jgi:nitroreductase
LWYACGRGFTLEDVPISAGLFSPSSKQISIDSIGGFTMELAQLIKERRTINAYEDRPVSVELVKELLDAARWVPNHKMTQPFRFILTVGDGRKRLAEVSRNAAKKKEKDPDMREQAGEAGYQKLMGSPVLLCVVMKENPNLGIREEDYASASCVIQNLHLLAMEKELGMAWKTPAYILQSDFREAIGVEPGEKIVGLIHLGYPAKISPAKPRKSLDELLTIIDHD